MGEMVSFPSDGATEQGYLALPASDRGPGVVVIQEWWGLVPHICDVCDRLAAEGFVALAPDVYQGATPAEPDDARRATMGLQAGQVARDLSGAVDEVARRSGGVGGVGVVGFCVGGGLALLLACQRPDRVKAVVPFYGTIPFPGAQPDYAVMTAALQGHYTTDDSFAGPDVARGLENQLRALGKEVEVFIYPGTAHGFFNDTRPGQYSAEASALAWGRTIGFLREQLGR